MQACVVSPFASGTKEIKSGSPLTTLCSKKAGEELLSRHPLAAVSSPTDRGSIITIVATDLPVSDRQLRRIIKRASVGLIRTGSHLGHSSGDIMIGFSTAYTLADAAAPAVLTIPILNESRIEQAFEACAEAAEEAILNSLLTAQGVTGFQRHCRHSLSE